MNWTEQQQDAIRTRDRSIIVSAAAGSGKTAVLVERLLQILADPSPDTRVGADEMIVVTFTKDAAAQMKQRLSRKISDTLDEMNRSGRHQDTAYDWLIQQRSALSNAKISTIHSFCFDFIRENADACGVSAQFSIAEPAREYIFKKRALQAVLTDWTQNRRTEIDLLFNYFCVRDDSEIEKYIEMTADYLNSQAFPSYWMKKAKAFCQEENTIFTDAIRKCFLEDMEVCIQFAERSRPFAIDAFDKADDRKFEACLNTDIAKLKACQQYIQSADKKTLLEEPLKYDVTFSKMPSVPKNSKNYDLLDKESQNIYKQIREMYKDKYKHITAWLLKPLKFWQEDEKIQKQMIPLLLELTEQYQNALFEEKKKQNVLSFDDAEHLVLNALGSVDDEGILHRSELAKIISDKYQLIMIDEYQDSNNKQDCLFKLLSQDCWISEDKKLHYGTNAFLVGDVKQSIYRFRQANPENFRRAVQDSTPLKACQNREMAGIYLNQNFRSSEGILNFINEMFRNVMSEACGELVYDENQQLNFGAENYKHLGKAYQGVQILLPKSDENFPAEDLQAECAADTIADMIANQFPVMQSDGTVRPCEYKDFCLLFRTLKQAKKLTEVFRRRGIPFSCEDEDSFLTLPEIRLIINLLRVIDNPMTDIAMAGVLLSPIYGFTPEDLAMLKVSGEKKYKRIYLQMQNLSEEENFTLAQKCHVFLSQLEQMRSLADTMPMEQFIYEIYEMTDLMSLQSLYEQADERREHLTIFTQYAQAYRESADFAAQSSLSGWLHYLDYMRESGEKVPVSLANQKANYISIKTIHKSKGLEYPFIFLMHTERKFSTKPAPDNLLPSETGMIGLQMVDRKRFLKIKSAVYQYLHYESDKQYKSEEMRLLYVAMTRAKQKLFLMMDEIYTGCSPKHICNMGAFLENRVSVLPVLTPELNSMQDWMLAYLLSSKEADYLKAAMDEGKNTVSEMAEYQVWKMHASEQTEEAQQQETVPADSHLLRKIQKQLDWEYTSFLTELPAKRSVTSLAHPEESFTEQADLPDFMLEDEEGRIRRLKGAARGTAIHKMMQFMDFKAASENLAQELERMRNAQILEKIEADSIRLEKIQAFFSSALYQRIAVSDTVLKEKQLFVQIGKLNLPETSLLLQNYLGTDGIMIGTVDLLFHEPDGWVLIDYKTDRVKEASQLTEKYALQLGLYQKAMELLLEEPVKQAYLYSFELDTAIEIDLSQIRYE